MASKDWVPAAARERLRRISCHIRIPERQLMSALGGKLPLRRMATAHYQREMANGPARAEFWKEFVANRCEYPAPDRLRAQLADAEFYDFCECGCNSFAVKANED